MIIQSVLRHGLFKVFCQYLRSVNLELHIVTFIQVMYFCFSFVISWSNVLSDSLMSVLCLAEACDANWELVSS